MLRLRFPSSAVTAALASCALAGFLFLGASMPTPAGAAADVAGLYTDALISGDAKALERLLAPNFIFIAPNGHIEDGSHFLESIRSRASHAGIGSSILPRVTNISSRLREVVMQASQKACYFFALCGPLAQLVRATGS